MKKSICEALALLRATALISFCRLERQSWWSITLILHDQARNPLYFTCFDCHTPLLTLACWLFVQFLRHTITTTTQEVENHRLMLFEALASTPPSWWTPQWARTRLALMMGTTGVRPPSSASCWCWEPFGSATRSTSSRKGELFGAQAADCFVFSL